MKPALLSSKVATRRDLWVVAAFTGLVFLPFIGKAWHNDEPFFLAAARHILADPWHPLGFDFTWYGSPTPAARINTTPPVLLYLLAFALKVTGGAEWAMRLFLFPLDLAAALGLYGLASRFLKRPLLPTLLVVAAPAYGLNLGHLMAEKPAAAFGFCGLYALVRGVDDEDRRWYWGSAALLAAALMSKYVAAVLLAPVAAYSLSRGVPWRRAALHLALCVLPLAVFLGFEAAFNHEVWERALSVTKDSSKAWWSGWPHKLRSFLAFTGGGALAAGAWAFLGEKRRAGAALAACALLFLSLWDLPAPVRLVDRATGVVFAAGGLLALIKTFSDRGSRGRILWVFWAAAAAFFQLFLYWSVMTRIVLFLVPPLVFALAEELEERADFARLGGLTLAGSFALSFALSVVDYHYAAAQKSFARDLRAEYLDKGRVVWYTGYMGLQYYLDRGGAKGLDALRGGWDLAQPGDVVVELGINSVRIPVKTRRLSNVRRWTLQEAIPLRLISGWTGEGGFYSNLSGFLPYSISREPLEEFRVIELL